MPRGIYQHKRGQGGMFGKHHSIKTIKLLRNKTINNYKNGVIMGYKKGEKHVNWLGDNAKYGAIHKWVRERLIKPKICPICGEEGKRLGLANIDHSYRRDLIDYLYMCFPCHSFYDILFNSKFKHE